MENSSWVGPACAFMSSVTWATGSVYYSRLARDHSPYAINVSRALTAAAICFVVAVPVCGGFVGAWDAFRSARPGELAWLAFGVFASYGLGDVLFMWSTRSLGVPAALALGSTYPILTAVFGALVEWRLPAVAQLGGMTLAVLGVIAVILSGGRREAARTTQAPRRERVRGIWLAFGAAVSWAFNGLGAAKGGAHLGPVVGNAFRMTFAILICGSIGRAYGREVALPVPVHRRWAWLFALEGFGGAAFFVYGMSHSPLAIGATLSSLAPVISVPIAITVGRERFSWLRTAGVCIVVTGIWLLLI